MGHITVFCTVLLLLVYTCGCGSNYQSDDRDADQDKPTIDRPSFTPTPIPTNTPVISIPPNAKVKITEADIGGLQFSDQTADYQISLSFSAGGVTLLQDPDTESISISKSSRR